MLSVLFKFKKILTLLLISIMLLNPINSFADTDVVIRPGEWGTPYNDIIKPGKRVYLSEEDCLNTNIRIRHDEYGYFISEWDINMAISKEIYKNLKEKNVDVDLQIATSKKEDLNSAGRIAKSKHPKIYLSIHHNYCKGANGYLFIYNQNDIKSMNVAKRLSNSIKKVTPVRQRENTPNLRENKPYIGELNEFKDTDTISVLAELGFFSDINGDLQAITSKQVIKSVAKAIADEIYIILREEGCYVK